MELATELVSDEALDDAEVEEDVAAGKRKSAESKGTTKESKRRCRKEPLKG
jgi:hypothetical protein